MASHLEAKIREKPFQIGYTGTLIIGDASHPQATSGSGNVFVASGAALGGYGQIGGSVQNDGTLAATNALPVLASGPTGTLRIGGSVANNGTLAFAAANGTSGNVLQIAGNYTGNGQVVLNTVLNQGGAASQSDRLVVGGNASGSTAIAINRSGIGAQTVGDGIELVQVGGTSAANSFRFGKRSTLYADVRYARNMGGDYRRTVFGQAGYRFGW